MARIELECDTPMDELHGFGILTYNGKGIGYTTSRLNEDEFNFISGMNYAVNHCLALILDNLGEMEELDDSVEMLHDLKKNIAGMALDAAKNSVNVEISQLITEFIDSNEVRTKRSAEEGGEAAEWQKEECSQKR